MTDVERRFADAFQEALAARRPNPPEWAGREALESLSYRERRIVELRYGLCGEHPQTLDDIGRTFNISRDRVAHLEDQAKKKLLSLAEAKKLGEVWREVE